MLCWSGRLLYAEIKVDWREESEPVSYIISPHAAIRSETTSKQRKLSEEERET